MPARGAGHDKKHRLVVIGWMGDKTAYLDVTREAAVRRWMEANRCYGELPDAPDADHIAEFEFDDEFSVYDASGPA